MTGVVFMHILKFKEIEQTRNKELQNQAIAIGSEYAELYRNRIMMDHLGSDRFYHLDPVEYVRLCQQESEPKEFLSTIHVLF